MNTNIENLNQLPLNKIGKIKKIDCEEWTNISKPIERPKSISC